jgi:hypothetical protein
MFLVCCYVVLHMVKTITFELSPRTWHIYHIIYGYMHYSHNIKLPPNFGDIPPPDDIIWVMWLYTGSRANGRGLRPSALWCPYETLYTFKYNICHLYNKEDHVVCWCGWICEYLWLWRSQVQPRWTP